VYSDARGERLAAALAYYATFSLAPLVVLVLAVAGLVYGRRSAAARVDLLAQAGDVLGRDGARLLEGLLEGAAAAPGTGVWATATSALALGIGATALYVRLQDALNAIWNVCPAHTGVLGMLWDRVRSLVLGTGLVLVAGLLLSSLLTGLAEWGAAPALLSAGERLLSLVLLTGLFALLYRTLPDAPVQWAEVGGGALGAAVLVTLGTAGLGWYLGVASVTSAYGAAGALVAFLLWVYYAAQVFFLGAAWTAARARRRADAAPTAAPKPAPAESPVPSPWCARLGGVIVGLALAWLLRR
jgi:membrane protein